MAFNPLNYLKESQLELAKVLWPTSRETAKLTLVVISVSVLIGAYIGGIDAIFTKIVEGIVK